MAVPEGLWVCAERVSDSATAEALLDATQRYRCRSFQPLALGLERVFNARAPLPWPMKLLTLVTNTVQGLDSVAGGVSSEECRVRQELGPLTRKASRLAEGCPSGG